MLDEINVLDGINETEYDREKGKELLKSNIPDERSEGIRLIHKAYMEKDPEASVIFATLLLNRVIRPVDGDGEGAALRILSYEAGTGNLQARIVLNSYCLERYENLIGTEKRPAEGPLVGFEGKKIKINRKGVLTPIDAVLEYKDGQNILTLSANIMFYYSEEISDRKRFEEAVLEGIKMWQGDYLVFGDQPVKVVVGLTTEGRIFDNVIVAPMTAGLSDTLKKMVKTLGTSKKKSEMESTLRQKRSFAVPGVRKWSSRSRKIIYIQCKDGNFDDYEEIMHVAKHEFGHTLGLGDLYESKADMLEGVEKGTYAELDGFHMYNRNYNLVMCDHHGPVSNNDIEMVILAYMNNKMQLYQNGRLKGEISKALGKGN